VAHDLGLLLLNGIKVRRCVMKTTQQPSSGGKLNIRVMAEFAWHVTGQEAQNLPAKLIDAEKSWGIRNPLCSKCASRLCCMVPSPEIGRLTVSPTLATPAVTRPPTKGVSASSIKSW
jgi:hypothetical protein